MVRLDGQAGHRENGGRTGLQPLGPDREKPLPWAVSEVQGSPRSLVEGVACGKGKVKSSSPPPQPIRKPHVLSALWASSYTSSKENGG